MNASAYTMAINIHFNGFLKLKYAWAIDFIFSCQFLMISLNFEANPSSIFYPMITVRVYPLCIFRIIIEWWKIKFSSAIPWHPRIEYFHKRSLFIIIYSNMSKKFSTESIETFFSWFSYIWRGLESFLTFIYIRCSMPLSLA